VEGPFKFWKVQDKRRLLLALMNELAGDAHISFEGDLRGLRLLTMPGASQEPTMALKRNTLSPEQDFMIVPLEPFTVEKIIPAIGGSVPKTILHIQIEKNGVLQFGAYDNFYPECIFFGSAVNQSMIEWLISESIMRPFTTAR
jgi:hypothetical protein